MKELHFSPGESTAPGFFVFCVFGFFWLGIFRAYFYYISKVHRSPKFSSVCCRGIDANPPTLKKMPLPITGTRCLVLFVGRAPALQFSQHQGDRREEAWMRVKNRRPILFGERDGEREGDRKRERERKYGQLLSSLLSPSSFCSWALCLEAEPKWVASTPRCVALRNDCCSHSVVPNQSQHSFSSL